MFCKGCRVLEGDVFVVGVIREGFLENMGLELGFKGNGFG